MDAGIELDAVARLFDATTDAVYGIDQAQRVLFWNAAAEEWFGIPSEEAIGQNCYELIRGTDFSGACICRADCATICAARQDCPVAAYDVLAHPPGKNRLWLSMGIVLVHVRDVVGPVAVHIARRVTPLLAHGQLTPGDDRDELAPALPGARVTPRGIDILRFLATGASIPAIARELVITPITVRNHIENILGKLGAHSRLEAVVSAARLGLIELPREAGGEWK